VILLVLAPGIEGIAQKTAIPLQPQKNEAIARKSAPESASMPGMNAQGTPSAVLTAIKTAEENGKIVISISTKGPIDYNAFTLSQPRRLVVDFKNAEINLPFNELPVNLAGVKQIRLRQMREAGNKIARLVIDLEDVKKVNHKIVTEDQDVKILIPSTQSSSVGMDKPASAVKPAAISKSETPAPKPAAASVQTSAPAPAAPAKAPSREKTAAAPKPEPQAKPPAVASTTKPKPVPEPVAPAKTPSAAKPDASAEKAPPVSKPKPSQTTETAAQAKPVAAPAPAVKPAPAAAPKSTGPEAKPPLQVAELPTPPRIVSDRVEREETAPVPAVMSGPAQPVTPPVSPPQAPATQARAEPAPATPSQASEQASRFSGSPLTVDLIDIPLVDFFRLMADEGGINVVMDPEIKGTLSIKVVKVPWDQILEAALMNNGLDKQIEGNLVRIAKKTTLQAEAKQREELKKANVLAADVETRIKRLNYAKAASFVEPLKEQKSVRGTISIDERTNSLILTDIPSFLEKMTELVETLDIPQPQVEIEARIVSANRDFARDLGVQFGFVQGNLQRTTVGGPNTFGTIGGTRPSQTPNSAYVAGNSATGRGASETKASQAASVSTGTGNQNAGNYNVNLPAGKAFGGIGLSVGNIFDMFLLDAAITAGESKGIAKLISQPRVVAQNNSSATITQGLRFPVQIVSNNTVTVQFQNAALTLIVTPQITLESNIVLDLNVENNTPDFSRAVNGIPSIRTSESKTRVLVTDGGTTVIGGIIIETDTNQSDRVPGLASLPGIGHLFKRTSVAKSSQEILFFITPKIVK